MSSEYRALPRFTRAAIVLGTLASLSVLSSSAAQDFAAGRRAVFDYPQVNGVALDWCVTWGTNCGQAAADNFCRAQGYSRSIGYLTYTPGRTNVAGQLCDGNLCGGFSRVECDGPQQANAGGQQTGGQSLTCQFSSGPLAGRTIDYSSVAGSIPGQVGQACTDGGASSGILVAQGSAATGGNPFSPPATPAGTATATSTATGGQNGVYPFPQANGVAVDGCATWAADCGQPSADQFCRTQGYQSASSWNWAYDQRTWVIGSNMYCDTGPTVNCGGLRDVVCTAGAGSYTPAATQTAANGPMAGTFTSVDFGTVTITGGPDSYGGSYINGRGETGTISVSRNTARGANHFSGTWQGGGYGGSLELTLQEDCNVYAGWNVANQFGSGAGNVWTRN